ncbi:MAG: aminotransferase class I/II-fold pyridoxal phosphate-dependent enzyme [Gemmataceae bacterium]
MIRSNIRAMSGYVPGEQLNDPDIVKLNTNENPYPPSPRVFDAIRTALTSDSLRKYPQPLGDSFRKAAGRVLNIDPDSILIGNGSDDILTILTRAFVPEGGLIASPTPSYILYKNLAEIQGSRFDAVPFTADWQLGENWPRADLAFLPNPNSPSGTVVPAEQIAELAGRVNALVLDQAYVDFSLAGRARARIFYPSLRDRPTRSSRARSASPTRWRVSASGSPSPIRGWFANW